LSEISMPPLIMPTFVISITAIEFDYGPFDKNLL